MYAVHCLTLHGLTSGNLDRITIQPGRTMKIIATVIGPLKKHIGKSISFRLITSLCRSILLGVLTDHLDVLDTNIL